MCLRCGNNKIVPNHCANFSFNGISQKNNNVKKLELNSVINKNSILDYNQINAIKNSIGGNTQLDKNDDYVSPTFNLNLNYNSLDKNNNNTTNTIESIKDKDKISNNKKNNNNNESSNKNDKKIKDNNFIIIFRLFFNENF